MSLSPFPLPGAPLAPILQGKDTGPWVRTERRGAGMRRGCWLCLGLAAAVGINPARGEEVALWTVDAMTRVSASR